MRILTGIVGCRNISVAFAVITCLLLFAPTFLCAAESALSNSRRPASDEDLQYWLENMLRQHRFTLAEASEATGMDTNEIAAAIRRFGTLDGRRPLRPPVAPLLVLPYPGGRHPRIG